MRKFLAILAVAVLAFLINAPTATAEHSGNPNTENLEHVVFSHVSNCGTASVSVTVPDETPPTWQYGAAVAVDGVIEGSVFQIGPGTNTLDLAFEEDQGDGSVLVEYSLEHATESDLLDGTETNSFEVDTDCEAEPTEDPTDPPVAEETDPPVKEEVDPPVKEETKEPTEEEIVAVPTKVAAGAELPKTGMGTTILTSAAGLALVGIGAIMLLFRRKLNQF